MASRFETSADKQVAENDRQERDTAKALHDAANYRTPEEKAEAERIGLFWHHKRAGSLGTYYLMYPTDPGARQFYAEVARYQFPDRGEQDRER